MNHPTETLTITYTVPRPGRTDQPAKMYMHTDRELCRCALRFSAGDTYPFTPRDGRDVRLVFAQNEKNATSPACRYPEISLVFPPPPKKIAAEMTPAVRSFVESLLARIEELESRLNRTPQNSSLPPSSQHPHAKPAPPPKSRSPRKSGGQPGHPKHRRALIPTEQCNHVETLKPHRCRRCGEPLDGDDPEPLRHQVWELPEIKTDVTEYQRHRLICPCCGESTTAPLPEGVPAVPSVRIVQGRTRAWSAWVLPGKKPYEIAYYDSHGVKHGNSKCPLMRRNSGQHEVEMRVAAMSESYPGYLAARVAAAVYGQHARPRCRLLVAGPLRVMPKTGYDRLMSRCGSRTD